MPTSLFDNLAVYLGSFLLAIAVVAASIAGLVGLYFLLVAWTRGRGREKKSLNSVTLQVAVPRENEVKIDAAEQMFSSFASFRKGGMLSLFKAQDHLTFEIVGTPQDIRFFVTAPEHLRDLVEKQIHGAYPGADIRVVPEYNIFPENGKVAFASLKLKSNNYLPVKVYKDLPVDPLSSLTSVLAKMSEGEGAAIQILLSPSDSKWQKQGRNFIAKTKKAEANPETAKYATDPKMLEAIESKISKPGFNMIVRVVVASQTEEGAKAHLSNIVRSFSQFTSDQNSFNQNKHLWKAAFMNDFIYRYFPLFGKTGVLSSEELATIYHFPNKSIETPHIFWLNAKRAPAPAKIPQSGLYLGQSTYRGVSRGVYIDIDDRRRHMYVIGKTGTGKSEFLKDMILQDIRNGEGVCFIDPHDTIDKLLPLIPPERAEDVVLFEPSDTTRPMGLNMLEAQTEEQKHYIVSSIVGLMYKLYDPHQTGIIGPRFEHAIRNAMLTVMAEKGNTFIEVVRALTDAAFVQELLPKVDDPIVRRYWTDQIAQTSDFHKSEVLDYIVSKFGRFVTNKLMRNIIGQSKSAFDFREVMDSGKILLVSLSKGRIG
ncbi:DUF87 domain-containing protein, partial [Candidatus Microgenomates bacterium]|nr:DUF87 domain-containing protein [Candidatus Microgenomates bacterium]